MCSLRISGPLLLTALLTATLSPRTHAQSPQSQFESASSISTTENIARLPDAPAVPQSTDQQHGGTISGIVEDANGAEIADATVALENTDSKVQRTLTTDAAGSFKFDSVEPGKFKLTITSNGFTPWKSGDLALQPGAHYEVPEVALHVAEAMTNVEVTVTQHDIAEDQMHFAEKQRVLGVFPNFYASYIWNAAPLSSGQKFQLALRTSIDPVTIAIPLLIAGVEQSQNDFSGYGQGARGFAKRFGASYTDSFTSTMFGGAILPSLLHQDPRYFYKGTGSIRARALYAIATVVICKGDSGRWQPNYSNVFGNLASASLSNLYYPTVDGKGARLTIDNWLIGTASGAIGSLFQEFLVKKISRGIQPSHEPEQNQAPDKTAQGLMAN
jgi:hypothetical protein